MHSFQKLHDVKNIDVPESCIAEIIQASSNDHAAKSTTSFVKNRGAANTV
jgi:hypothetical protein